MRKSTLVLLLISLVAITCKETDTVYEPVNSLTDPSVVPAVIYTFPAKNTAGPYYGFSTALTVRFNKLMDLASLHHAIHFYSADGDLLPDTNLISINQGDVATITPIRASTIESNYYKAARTYTLRIDSTAKDINGNRLSPSFKMTFTPEPFLRVKSIFPGSGAVNVGSNTLQLQFNAPVDSAMFSRVRFTPPVSGAWTYPKANQNVIDSSTIVFTTDGQVFPPSQTMTVSIGSHAFDIAGDSLVGGFSSAFSTVQFAALGSDPHNGSIGWQTTGVNVSVAFNDALDTSTVRRAFRISPPVSGQIGYLSDLATIVFVPSAALLADTTYTVTVDTSIRSEAHARLSGQYSFTFSTVAVNGGGVPSLLGVEYVSPNNGESDVTPTQRIIIEFYKQIDTASFRNGFSISPSVAGLLSVYPYNSNEMMFSPIMPLALGTTYTVTLAGSVKSTTGDSLGTPYIFSFSTEPFEITNTYPQNGITEVSLTPSLEFYTSDVIDTSTIRASFSISPAAAGNFSFYYGEDSFYFYPTSALQPYTIYTVTISTALKSQSGTPLVAPYTYSFATGGN